MSISVGNDPLRDQLLRIHNYVESNSVTTEEEEADGVNEVQQHQSPDKAKSESVGSDWVRRDKEVDEAILYGFQKQTPEKRKSVSQEKLK